MGEQRYKVGDWVRSLADWGSIEAGKVYKIPHLDNEGEPWFTSDGAGGWCDYLTLGEIEPWQPRVGERVRYSGKSQAYSEKALVGLEGVVTEVGSRMAIVKWDKAIVDGIRTGGEKYIENIEPILTAATPAQPATLKAEAGKFYKTRDGRKVGPMAVDRQHDRRYGWTVAHEFNAEYGKAWRGDGTFHPDVGTTHSADIIAEWIDEPTAKAEASNDNAQPKFKVGDVVKRFKGNNPGSEVGHEATISKIEDISGWDDNGPWLLFEDGTSGYATSFRFATTTTPTPTIVALIENGQPKPSSTLHVHASTGAAEKEAKRLAAKFKGQQFGVFTLTTTHHEPNPVYDHKWQNLAVLGLKIDAIKELRSITGMGLKPAKDAVEYFLAAA